MPYIHFKNDIIEVHFKGNNIFTSEVVKDDVTIETKQFQNGEVQGYLRTEHLFVTLYPNENLLEFTAADSTLEIELTDFQKTTILDFFENGDYHELEVPEKSNNNNNNNNNNEDPVELNNKSTNGGKRSTRRRKIKHRKSKKRLYK
jgi:hypothetical protein